MKETGLFTGVFGIEVTTEEELKKVAKGITIAQIKKTIEILRKNNIAVVADIMMGFDYDTEAIIKQRFEFTDEVDPDILWIGYVTPAPNSPMWKIGMKKGWIDYDKIDTIRGMDICITTTARNDDEGRALLRAFNFPLKS